MNPLLSTSSLMILESLSFTKTLYAFDFDGTLSKIVRTPSQALVTHSTNELIKKLAAVAPVAIISGRSVDDLKARLQYKPPYLIGNHGLEGLNKNVGTLTEAKAACKQWKLKLQTFDFGPGVEIEDKTYSLAIHYRRSRNKTQVKEKIKNAISLLKPSSRIMMGKSVFNLLPSGAPHKGVALLQLMNQIQAKHAFYIGDDDTDEDVFSLPDSKIMTVRVGFKKSSHAQFHIDRQSEINLVLKHLLRFNLKSKGET